MIREETGPRSLQQDNSAYAVVGSTITQTPSFDACRAATGDADLAACALRVTPPGLQQGKSASNDRPELVSSPAPSHSSQAQNTTCEDLEMLENLGKAQDDPIDGFPVF